MRFLFIGHFPELCSSGALLFEIAAKLMDALRNRVS